jgi:hypothetical protein
LLGVSLKKRREPKSLTPSPSHRPNFLRLSLCIPAILKPGTRCNTKPSVRLLGMSSQHPFRRTTTFYPGLLKSSRSVPASRRSTNQPRIAATLIAASCISVPAASRAACPGGANRDRTGDLLLAKQALSQLSYGPASGLGWWVWMDSNHRPPPYQDGALTN